MADFYPMMVNLKEKLCVVIGGGAIAERKVLGLLEAGADRLVVVSPLLTEELQRLAEMRSIRHKRREYKEEDLADAFLVFAATGNRTVNHSISLSAAGSGVLCNVADKAEEGAFITPAVVRRGDLLLAVTSGGASPSLIARIKRELEMNYGKELGTALPKLSLLRKQALEKEPDEKRRHAILKLAAQEILAYSRGESPAAERSGSVEEEIGGWLNRLQDIVEKGHEE